MFPGRNEDTPPNRANETLLLYFYWTSKGKGAPRSTTRSRITTTTRTSHRRDTITRLPRRRPLNINLTLTRRKGIRNNKALLHNRRRHKRTLVRRNLRVLGNNTRNNNTIQRIRHRSATLLPNNMGSLATRRTLSNMPNFNNFYLIDKSRRSITLGKIALQYTMTTMNKVNLTRNGVTTIRHSLTLGRCTFILQKRVTYGGNIVNNDYDNEFFNGYTSTRKSNGKRRRNYNGNLATRRYVRGLRGGCASYAVSRGPPILW